MSELLKKQIDGVMKKNIQGSRKPTQSVRRKWKKKKKKKRRAHTNDYFWEEGFENSLLNNGGMDFSELWVIDSQRVEGTSTLVTGDSGR